MLTSKQVLVAMYQFRGVGAKTKVRKVYNDYAEKHGKSKRKSKEYTAIWCVY